MNFELYEVWAEDEDGHTEVQDTTASRKQAFEIAESLLGQGYLFATVFQETEDGDLKEIQRFESARFERFDWFALCVAFLNV